MTKHLILLIATLPLQLSASGSSASASASASAMDIDSRSDERASDQKRASAAASASASANAPHTPLSLTQERARVFGAIHCKAHGKMCVDATLSLKNNPDGSLFQDPTINLFDVIKQFDSPSRKASGPLKIYRVRYENFSDGLHFDELLREGKNKLLKDFKEALESGADPNQCNTDGLPILSAALDRAMYPIANLLLAHPDIDVNQQDARFGVLPLKHCWNHLTFEGLNSETLHMLFLLLQKGASLDRVSYCLNGLLTRGWSCGDAPEHPDLANSLCELLINMGTAEDPDMFVNTLAWNHDRSIQNSGKIPSSLDWSTLKLFAGYGMFRTMRHDQVVAEAQRAVSQCNYGFDEDQLPAFEASVINSLEAGRALYLERIAKQTEVIASLCEGAHLESVLAYQENRAQKVMTQFDDLIKFKSPSTDLILPFYLIESRWLASRLKQYFSEIAPDTLLPVCGIIADYLPDNIIHTSSNFSEHYSDDATEADEKSASASVSDMDVDEGDIEASPTSAAAGVTNGSTNSGRKRKAPSASASTSAAMDEGETTAASASSSASASASAVANSASATNGDTDKDAEPSASKKPRTE